MKLESVPVGFRDVYQGTANEDFENPQIETRAGSGTQAVTKTGPKTLELTVNGDAPVGENTSFAVKIDGHIGDGEAEIVTEFDYDTVSPDATTISFAKVRREPIPAP